MYDDLDIMERGDEAADAAARLVRDLDGSDQYAGDDMRWSPDFRQARPNRRSRPDGAR